MGSQFAFGGGARRLGAVGRFSGASPERADDHNQRVTLQAIRALGPISRDELAQVTGLPPPVIAGITRRLADMGLVLDADLPAASLVANPAGCFSIGVHIDRDHITAVLVDFAGEVLARESLEIALPTPDDVARFWTGPQGRRLMAALPESDRMLGVGVALADDFDKADPPPHRPKRFDAWNDLDSASLFAHVDGLPVFVENVAAAAALGELQHDHGLRRPSFFYVLIAAGLGGGLVIEGEHFRGANGRGGEFGFLPARGPGGPALGSVVSLSALYAHIEAGGFLVGDPASLLDLPARGQALVGQWIDMAADALTDAMISISCLINPEAIYLGGRLPADLIDHLASALNARLAKVSGPPVIAPVRRAKTSTDGPAIGAAILPMIDRLLPSRSTPRAIL